MLAADFAILVGSIVFIATFARPDVAYAAHLLSSYMARPGPVHMQLARRLADFQQNFRKCSISSFCCFVIFLMYFYRFFG